MNEEFQEEDYEYDPCPCDSCPSSDHCDGWEARFCCTLCTWSGGGWNCDDCDPMDI